MVEGVVPQGVDYAYKTGAWPHDIKKAKALLAEAGYPNGFESTLWSAYNDGTSVKAVQFRSSSWPRSASRCRWKCWNPASACSACSRCRSRGSQGPHVLRRLVSSTGEADWGLRPLLTTPAFPPVLNNVSYYSNKAVDDGVQEALATTDRAKKTEIYKNVQETIWKDAPWAFLVTQNNLYVRSKNLSGVYVEPDTSFWFGDIDLKQ